MADSYVLTVEGLRFAKLDTKPVSFLMTRLSFLSMIPRTALGSNVGLYPVAARRSGACPGRPGLGYGGSRRYTPSLVVVNVNRLEEASVWIDTSTALSQQSGHSDTSASALPAYKRSDTLIYNDTLLKERTCCTH